MPPRRLNSPGSSTASTRLVAVLDEPVGQFVQVEAVAGAQDPAGWRPVGPASGTGWMSA